jgi:hypothetical protein
MKTKNGKLLFLVCRKEIKEEARRWNEFGLARGEGTVPQRKKFERAEKTVP